MMKKCTGRNGRNGKTFATYAISATANFYTSGMACRRMDDVRRNAGLKYSERKLGFLRKRYKL